MTDNNIPALAPGTVLAGAQKYTIVRVIGAGGFGITYLATTEVAMGNVTVQARVAIKEHFMSDHNERDAATMRVTTPGTQRSRQIVADSLRDFLGEARRLQNVGAGHPNIVRVSEVFEANGTAYYAMEYLEGTSLWSAVEGRGMAEADMLAVMLPIIDAAAYLHRNRLTHLDIKPQNIMLATERGGVRPVLIDFGLSKHYDGEGHATSTVNTLACSDGFSPVEQYSGITTFTPAADVYALGATILACLTGQIPPKSTDWSATLRMQYIGSMNISEPLRAALRGALADIENRFPDADTLLAALGGEASQAMERRVLTSAPDQASASTVETRRLAGDGAEVSYLRTTRVSSQPASKPISSRRSLAWAIAAIFAGLLVLGAAAYFIFGGHGNPDDPVNAPVDSTLIAENRIESPEQQPAPAENPQPAPAEDEASAPSPDAAAAEAAAAEAAARAEQERLDRERQQREEQERLDRERQQREEQERLDRERQQREEQEHLDRERQQREEQERLDRERREREEAAAREKQRFWNNYRTARNLYLAVEHDGRQYYFSQSDWNNLTTAQRNECRKLGVVIDKNRERFILGLDLLANGEELNWDFAFSHFGNQIPTKAQAKAIKSQRNDVKRAITNFGGSNPDAAFWEKERDSNGAWQPIRPRSTGETALLVLVGVSPNMTEKPCQLRPVFPLAD